MTMITISGLEYKLYLDRKRRPLSFLHNSTLQFFISPELRKILNYPSLLRKSPNCYQMSKAKVISHNFDYN